MTDAGLDRHALTINLGGGVICDMGGFCAATFKRGIRFIQCPTTLLSQVDAGVGGKLGIDFGNLKNHIGLFREPDYVVISNSFLKTLPEKELRSGYAEMIKHSLIARIDDWKRQRKINILEIPAEDSIRHSIGIKYNIVSRDPKEGGYRKVLNFGHTIGHAIEGILLHDPRQKVTHGDCVALGMLAEAQLSHKYADMKKSDLKSICDYLTLHYEKIDLNGVTREAFFNSLMQDKKNRGEEIRATLIRKPGDCVTDIPVSLKACWEALKFYEGLYNLF